ncbi:hypothetical protein, partial [Klebsiella pneumoniae]|uniref:hypothetical protein n=1 Tax=Klebsiella pneumoniae TaxID=573 RepID=UPI001B8BAEC8
KRAYCLKTQPATGETYPKSDLFNKALWHRTKPNLTGSSVPNMVIRILRVSLLSVSAGSKSGERAYGSRRCPACKGPEKAF